MINELKDYYCKRHAIITRSRNTAFQMHSELKRFYPELHARIEALYQAIQTHRSFSTDNNFINICHFAEHMKRVAHHTTTHLSEIDTLTEIAHQQEDKPLNLENFKDIPTLFKVNSYTHSSIDIHIHL